MPALPPPRELGPGPGARPAESHWDQCHLLGRDRIPPPSPRTLPYPRGWKWSPSQPDSHRRYGSERALASSWQEREENRTQGMDQAWLGDPGRPHLSLGLSLLIPAMESRGLHPAAAHGMWKAVVSAQAWP